MKITADRIKSHSPCAGQVDIWYLGQEGFLFRQERGCIGIDLYLSDYVDRHCSRSIRWQRRYAPPVEAERLDFLDAVLCTHAHYDHADPATLVRIAGSNPDTRFVISAPEVPALEKMGIPSGRILPAIAGQTLCLAGFEILPVPAAHEQLRTDAGGNYPELAYIIRTAGKTLFHGGDICMYDGLIENLRPFRTDVAFLPINGRDYFRSSQGIVGNLNCEEAVLLAGQIQADMLVPMHHDLYEVNRVRPAHFVDAVETLDPLRKYHIFAPGELYILG